MSGPYPYAPIQYQELQNLIFPGQVKVGDRSIWEIHPRTPLFFASSTNKGAVSFWQGAAIARDPSGIGFVLANNGSAAGVAIGLACLGAPGTQPEIVQLAGLFTLNDWTPVTGTVSLTALAYYWLDSTNGKLTTVKPVLPTLATLVGYPVSPQTLNIGIVAPSNEAYGEIFLHDNAVPLAFAVQNQFYIFAFATWQSELVNGFTADLANSRLVCNVPGVYQVTAVIDYEAPADNFEFSVFVSGVQQMGITAHSVPRGLTQTICTTVNGLVTLAANDTLDIRGRCTSGPNKSITVIHSNLGAFPV